MSFLKRLAQVLRSNTSESPEPPHAAGAADAPPDAALEEELRASLHEDPNDPEAFKRLAEVVLLRTQSRDNPDPLIADTGPIDLKSWVGASQWALAEELAGNPRAWYPLVVLARLSLEDDHEGAMRRLSAACEREATGVALVEGITMLRQAHLPSDALTLGVGHWDPAHQIAEAGRAVIHAALDAGRPAEARQHLRNLSEYGAQQQGAAEVVAELEPFVKAADDA